MIIIVILLFAIPLGLRLLQQQQILKSRAGGGGPIIFQGVNVTNQNGKQVFRLDDQGQPSVGLTLTSPFGEGSNSVPNSSISPISQAQNKINWVTNDISIQADDFYMIYKGKKYTSATASVQLTSSQDTSFGGPTIGLGVIWPEQNYHVGLVLVAVLKDNKWTVPVMLAADDDTATLNYGVPYNTTGIGNSLNNAFFSQDLLIQNDPPSPNYVVYFKNVTIKPFFNSLSNNSNLNLNINQIDINSDVQSICKMNFIKTSKIKALIKC